MNRRPCALFLAAVMFCGLTACNGQPEPSEAQTPVAESRFVPGTYTGEGQGFGGLIKVEVTLSTDKIERVTVIEHKESEGIGSKAVDTLPDAIVAAQSVQVDAVGGASLSSAGINEAVTAALISAGTDASSLSPVVGNDNISTPSEEQFLDADVVIVGAGGAGMTAAVAAARAGKKVIILEKTAMTGGNSVRSTGGMNAAKTDWQDDNGWNEANGVEKTLRSAGAVYPELSGLAAAVQTEYDSWKTAGSEGYFDSVGLFVLDTMIGGKNINDLELVTTLAEGSAAAIDWLENTIGAELHSVGSFGGASVKRIHRPINAEGKIISMGSYIVPILEQACIDNGVEILFNAPVTEILMADGKAIGVKAEGYTVNARSVVLATGGFGANLNMVTQLKPELDGFVTTNAPSITGDGIKMAQAVGAATVDMDQIQIHPTVEQTTSALITEGLRGDGAILVNAEGYRFCDEVGTRDAVSAAVLAQTGGYAWLIVDQRMVDASNVITGYISKGYTVQGKSPAELAGVMGVPETALTETMDKWNRAAAARTDAEFGRTSFSWPLDTTPLYAIKIAPGVHHTMGGVKINPAAHVIDLNGSEIPGLFAAGEVTGGIHGADRLGGNAVADFVVFGRIAGESAAAYAE